MATSTAVKTSSTAYVVVIDTRTPIGVAQLTDSIWIAPGRAAAREREINRNPARHPDKVAWVEAVRVDGGRLVNCNYVRGVAIAVSKLNEANVREARERHRLGETTRGLADEYGVSRQAMSNALYGITWAHVA